MLVYIASIFRTYSLPPYHPKLKVPCPGFDLPVPQLSTKFYLSFWAAVRAFSWKAAANLLRIQLGTKTKKRHCVSARGLSHGIRGWKETAAGQAVERLKAPVTVVERCELCRATTALSIMDRDTLTCAPAVADGVLALQLQGKSCGGSGSTHCCCKCFLPPFQENVDKNISPTWQPLLSNPF
jgi:hypothetical protein